MQLRLRLGFFVTLAACSLPACFAANLTLRQDPVSKSISVFREGEQEPILTQNAGAEFRPYLHPIVSPDGKSVLTEFSPVHHKHQTGLYWGLAKINDRSFFHNPGAGYWRRLASTPIVAAGAEVKWSTTYHLLDTAGQPLMTETQLWAMHDKVESYVLELEWTGEAVVDLTMAKTGYGGLFLRMPWRAGMEGAAINNARQGNARAEAQRAVWVDVGLKVEGRDDLAHIAILDHPKNDGYPSYWRVDQQLGVGPSRSMAGEWKIPRGQKSVFRHQFIVYTGGFNDLKVDEAWKDFSGEAMDGAMWGLARNEGKQAVFLTGEQAVAKMTAAPGFEVKLTAAEPMITQPIAFCWDDRGRLWVAENRDYESRRTGFSGSGDSRIVILEDTDGDGKMDSRKVFLDKIPFPAAIAVGLGGLWLGAPPNLLFVPDRNRDDQADDAIEVRLTGWGIQDRHETLNSLNWGPDGWLYGCQGFATTSRVGKPLDRGKVYRPGDAFPTEVAVKDPQFIDGGVWRYHPTKDRFEVVAHGFSNPWGLDFDDHGQMFITACVIPHLWHVIPGGFYHRQGGKHISPYIYDDIKTIANHRHRSAHGGARIYLADEFPAKYRERIFMANLHEHALLTDFLEAKGSGFIGRHGDDALLANDPQWVGFSVELGPDGAVYILDWHDADICGASVLTKETGRIFRFAPKGLPAKTGLNLAALSDAELIELQLHRNDWYVRRARVLLQQRAAEGHLSADVPAKLWTMFEQQSDDGRKLRALWALHVTKNLPTERLVALLDDPAPYIRGWAIQLLAEDFAPGAAALAKFAALAQTDPSPVVRLYLASVLNRLPLADRWPIAAGLVQHGEDTADHNLPKMIWFAVEPLVLADPAKALALASQSNLPLVSQFIARRATAGKQLDVIAAALASNPPRRTALLEGLRDGLADLGQRATTAPARWPAIESALLAEADPALRDLALQIGQLFGSAQATAAQLVALADPSAPTERRREILLGFSRDRYAPALPAVLGLLDEPALRRDAIRALASFDDAQVPAALLQRYPSLAGPDKTETILTLAARPAGARPLFAALKAEKIPKPDISAFAARQLHRVVGPAFVDFWGPLTQPAADKDADIAKFKRQLTDKALANANLPNGRAVFERTCAACHMLYDQGGLIGPDLTGSNRANLDYILAQIINPSEEIQEAYKLVTINTQDGRVLAGNVVAEDDQKLTLRLVGQDTIIAKSAILARETSPVSMMPEGLLKNLPSDDIRDLIAYLKTNQQVPLP